MFSLQTTPGLGIRPLLGLLVALVVLAGCGNQTVGEREEIANRETILAGTPSPTPSHTPTPTTPPTATPTPSPAPTNTPTATPLPPTPTPNPALDGFGFCTQTVGRAENGRFSARLQAVTTETFPAFERLTLDFALASDSGSLGASASCVTARDYTIATNEPAAPGSVVLQVYLDSWLQDDAFANSILSETLTLTQTTIARNVQLRPVPDVRAGALISVGLEETVLTRLSLEGDSQLVIEVARSSPLVVSSDQLTLATTGDQLSPPEPIFFLLAGDIWRADSTGTISLTQSLEDETDLAVSADGQFVAFCRTQEPGSDPAARDVVPSALWVMTADGQQQRRLAAPGVSCADPAFSPDGALVAFSVDETGSRPTQRSIWVVPVSVVPPVTPTPDSSGAVANAEVLPDESAPQLVAGSDEWNRFAPQWLDAETLVYAADAPDGRSTLFWRALAEPTERDIGAELVVGDRYRAIGPPWVAPDGRAVAVVGERLDDSGADLVLLDADGAETDVISGGYWTRPFAWGDDGTLYYLTTQGASTLVQDYALFQRNNVGATQLVMAGLSVGAFGTQAVAANNSLVYVAGERALPGVRATSQLDPQGSSALWLWELETGQRNTIFRAERRIEAVTD